MWFGNVSKNSRISFVKFSHEFNPSSSASLISVPSNSYCTLGVLFVLNNLIFLISGNPGNFSFSISISYSFNSNSPSASLTSSLSSSVISSQRSNSEIFSSLFNNVNACRIVVFPLSFRPTNAAKSPTVISPES